MKIRESNSDNDNRIEVEANDVPTVTNEEEESTQEPATTRSGRTITRPSRYNANQMKRMERKHLILHQTNKDHENHIEYDTNVAVVAAKVHRINHFRGFPETSRIRITVYPAERF
jgi:hypothetical protein